MNATRHHAIVAAIAVAVTGSLAAANHFRWKDQATIEAFVVVPQQPVVTTDTAPALTTGTSPAVTCASTMDDLRHGRLGPFAFHDMEENVIAAIDSDAIWPGRHVLVVHAQRDGGNHPPSRTLVIGCEGDQARAPLDAEGIPSIDGAALKIENTSLLSNVGPHAEKSILREGLRQRLTAERPGGSRMADRHHEGLRPAGRWHWTGTERRDGPVQGPDETR